MNFTIKDVKKSAVIKIPRCRYLVDERDHHPFQIFHCLSWPWKRGLKPIASIHFIVFFFLREICSFLFDDFFFFFLLREVVAMDLWNFVLQMFRILCYTIIFCRSLDHHIILSVIKLLVSL